MMWETNDATAAAARATVRLAKVSEIALREVELSLPQYRLLTYLAEGSAAAAALAERLIVSRPSVTTLVDGLVARGLVERQGDAADRRRVDHLLTVEGRRTLERADAEVATMLGSLTDRLGPDDARVGWSRPAPRGARPSTSASSERRRAAPTRSGR